MPTPWAWTASRVGRRRPAVLATAVALAGLACTSDAGAVGCDRLDLGEVELRVAVSGGDVDFYDLSRPDPGDGSGGPSGGLSGSPEAAASMTDAYGVVRAGRTHIAALVPSTVERADLVAGASTVALSGPIDCDLPGGRTVYIGSVPGVRDVELHTFEPGAAAPAFVVPVGDGIASAG